MKLIIKATNFKLTPAIRQYIEEKLKRDVERYLPAGNTSAEGWAEAGKTTKHHQKGMVFRAEMQIGGLAGKKSVRAESTNTDLRLAIDEVKDELQRILKKYKGKQSATYKRGARRAKKDLRLSRGARFYRKGRILEEGI